MPDKQLLRLLGEDKRYIYRAVLRMLTGSLCNIGFTACLCYGLQLLFVGAKASFYPLPFVLGAVCAAVRFLATIRAAAVRDGLGRSVKKSLRAQLYTKLLRLGVQETKTVKLAGLTQLATEGIEQLDLYYFSYLPQFFYAMLSPLLLFGICVFLNWRVAAVLLACVPLIPVSIVAVSRFAKRIFARCWGKYTAMGDVFLDSVQGLKELKLFRADARRQAYMNKNAEEFRKITMKVLVMQLASVTIMDLVAFGGAGIGAALAVSGTQNGEGGCRRAVSGAGGGGVLPAAPGLRKRLPCGHERDQRGANDADAAGGGGACMGQGTALRREAGAGGRAFFLCAGAGDAARRIRHVS